MKILSGSFSTALRQRPNSASSTSSALSSSAAGLVSLPSYLPCGMLDEEILPDFQAAREYAACRSASTRSRVVSSIMSVLERNTGRAGPGLVTLPAHRRVEALHALRVGQVVLHRAVRCAQRVEELASQPSSLAISFSKNAAPLSGATPSQFGPRLPRARAAGHHGLAVADLEHAAEEIQHVRIGLEPRHGHGLAQLLGGLRVELGEAQVQPAERGIGEEVVDELAGFSLSLALAASNRRRKSTGTAVGVKVVAERPVGAQRLLQLGQREAGIDGEEGARGVDGFEHHFAAAAAAHAEAEDAQQLAGLRRLAGLDLDDLARRRPAFPARAPARGSGCTSFRYSVCSSASLLCDGLVAVGDDVARQGRQNVVRGRDRATAPPCGRRSAAVRGSR